MAAGTPELMSGYFSVTPSSSCILAFEIRLFDSSRLASGLPG